MSYQVPLTVAKALERIHRHDYVIPAIQREFVWSPTQIGNLFDSLLRKYPIGTFLFWQVPAADSRKYAFYDVMREYHELKNRHSQVITTPESRDVTAILDGQQRLTSLNIGLLGSYAVKRPGARVAATDAYPSKKLHLDLCYEPDPDDELGVQFMFRFLTDGEVASDNAASGRHWVPARLGLDIRDGKDVFKYVQHVGLAEHPRAYEALFTLWEAITQQASISYFELENHSLDQVLDIFIRVNSGGTVLSKSDLLLSVATAQFRQRDAREAIHGLVDDLNAIGQGFTFTKDIVLKAGLLLTDSPKIQFNAMSFTAESMTMLDETWDDIDRSLRVAIRLLASFGLSAKNLTANSVLLPVADYVHQRRLGDEFVTAVAHQADREQVRIWVIRSLVKTGGIWGSALDATLVRLRRVLRLHGGVRFPRVEIERELAAAGKSLDLGVEELEDLADSTYQQKRSFLLLSLLYPGVDTRNEFHVDHVFPRSGFTDAKLKATGVSGEMFDAMKDASERLANLQLLEGAVNVSKQQTLPLAWAATQYPNTVARAGYLAAHDLHDLPADLTGFLDFHNARRERMKARLAALVSADLRPLTPLVSVPTGSPTSSLPPPVDAASSRQVAPTARPALTGRRTRRSFNRSLDNIADGPIEWRFRGVVHHARIEGAEIVLQDGRRLATPTAACEALVPGPVNGWRAWKRGSRTLADLHP